MLSAGVQPSPPRAIACHDSRIRCHSGRTRKTCGRTASAAAKAQAADPSAQDAPREEALAEAISSVEEYIKPFNNRLEFSIDDDIGRVVVKVVDKETEDVILQIPSEEMLAIAKALDNIKGLFIKQQA